MGKRNYAFAKKAPRTYSDVIDGEYLASKMSKYGPDEIINLDSLRNLKRNDLEVFFLSSIPFLLDDF